MVGSVRAVVDVDVAVVVFVVVEAGSEALDAFKMQCKRRFLGRIDQLLTNIDVTAGRALAELFALVRECHVDDARNAARRRLHAYRVRRDELWSIETTSHTVSTLTHANAAAQLYLTPHQHRAEHHLQAVEEIVADDDDLGAAVRPALAGRNRLDARRRNRQRRIQTCMIVQSENIDTITYLFRASCARSEDPLYIRIFADMCVGGTRVSFVRLVLH